MVRDFIYLLAFIVTLIVVYVWASRLLSPIASQRKLESMLTGKEAASAPMQGLGAPVGARAVDSARTSATEIVNPVTGTVAATVSSARFEECGVLTGDYVQRDRGHDHYVDYVNGWLWGENKGDEALKGDADVVVSAAARHFGTKGIEVTNAFGPARNFRLVRKRDYVMSAMLKRVAGNVPLERGMVLDVDYRQSTPSGSEFPIVCNDSMLYCSGRLRVEDRGGGWYYLEMQVPASVDLPSGAWARGYNFARVYVGAPNGDGKGGDATVCVDDIRFYPAGSEVRSYYFDGKSKEPVACVGPKSKPMACKEGDASSSEKTYRLLSGEEGRKTGQKPRRKPYRWLYPPR